MGSFGIYISSFGTYSCNVQFTYMSKSWRIVQVPAVKAYYKYGDTSLLC